MLLTLIGSKVFSVIRDLCSSDSPTTKTFDELLEILKSHYSPHRNVIAERFKFNRCRQSPSQSVNEYSACLKKLANTCKFGTFLDEMLRDKLIEGLRDSALQTELLKKEDLTFVTALKLAQAYELTVKTATELQKNTGAEMEAEPKFGTSASVDKMHYGNREQRNSQKYGTSAPVQSSTKAEGQIRKCYRCNGTSHLANNCKFRSCLLYTSDAADE